MASSDANRFSVGSSIPVLRMLDEEMARRYYVDYLGFTVEWEHRFSDDDSSPLYMQVRLGEAVLHLNGHADDSAPVTEVRFPVDGLQNYCDHLGAKTKGRAKPVVVDPRYTGRNTDMNLIDPFGNVLVFWSPSDGHDEPE